MSRWSKAEVRPPTGWLVVLVECSLTLMLTAAACGSRTGLLVGPEPDAEPEPFARVPIDVAVGREYSCAWRDNGEAWCWGHNDHGQLGDGTTTDRSLPSRMQGLDGVAGIAASAQASCAWLDDGSAWCWGGNGAGQLLDGTTDDRSEPARLDPLEAVVGVVVGTLAWFGDGSLSLLQANDGGGLEVQVVETPGPVAGASAYGPWALSHRSIVAWQTDGAALGVYDENARPIESLGHVAGMTAATHTCAWHRDGSALCYGGNDDGELGNGTIGHVFEYRPTQVLGLDSIVGMVAGVSHTCAWLDDGSAWCWGSNDSGQLGDGTTERRLEPVRVVGLEEVVSMSTYQDHSCAGLRDGSVWCWGRNDYGQLGDGTTVPSLEPVQALIETP